MAAFAREQSFTRFEELEGCPGQLCHKTLSVTLLTHVTFLVLILLSPLRASATSRLPVTDHFPYSAGNLGTVGSSGNWSGSTTTHTIVAGNLDGTSLGLATSSANMVSMGSGTSSTYNTFASASGDITSGKVYCSFLVKINDVTSVSTSGENTISLAAQNSTSARYVELWFKNVAGAVQLGLAKNGGAPSYISSGAGSALANGSVCLIVLSHEFAAGALDDIVKLWANPSSLGTATEDPNPRITINTGADVSTSAGIGRFLLSGGVVCNIDELRLSAVWADVTPPGVPVSPPVTQPYFTRASFTPQGLVLQGTNGASNGVFTVLMSSNLLLPQDQWTPLGTGNFNSAGAFNWTNASPGPDAQKFFRLLSGGSSGPFIVSQPQNVETTIGQSASFTVVAGGTPPLSYRWFFNTNTALALATNASLTITNVSTNDLGFYSVLVSNTFGSVTSAFAQLALIVPPTNGDFFVSPSGNDNNPGTLASPFFSLTKAISVAQPGNLIYVRGGAYFYTQTIRIDSAGTAGTLSRIWAYPGEHPLLDFTNQPYADANRAFLLTTNGNYWHIKGLEIARAGDNGMKIEGSHNRIEQCVFHDCGDTGLQIGFAHETSNNGSMGSSNLVLNCDSYHNYDFATRGGNADGFACKLHPGAGNVFIGCRAWFNSDDAWDLFESDSTVVISNCWAWHSGDKNLFPSSSSFGGNGNGFKLGGDGAGGSSKGTHLVMNCVAFNCNFPNTSANGFTDNSHADGETVLNCVAFNCNYNFFFEQSVNQYLHQ